MKESLDLRQESRKSLDDGQLEILPQIEMRLKWEGVGGAEGEPEEEEEDEKVFA